MQLKVPDEESEQQHGDARGNASDGRHQCLKVAQAAGAGVRGPRARGAQTRQGAPALIRYMQNDKCRARAKSGPLMAIMTLLRPGGTA